MRKLAVDDLDDFSSDELGTPGLQKLIDLLLLRFFLHLGHRLGALTLLYLFLLDPCIFYFWFRLDLYGLCDRMVLFYNLISSLILNLRLFFGC